MRTEQEFWDDALLAALTVLARPEGYGAEFPAALIEDATRIADAACEARDKRLPAFPDRETFPDMRLRGETSQRGWLAWSPRHYKTTDASYEERTGDASL